LYRLQELGLRGQRWLLVWQAGQVGGEGRSPGRKGQLPTHGKDEAAAHGKTGQRGEEKLDFVACHHFFWFDWWFPSARPDFEQ
jgi:hypothetical protein